MLKYSRSFIVLTMIAVVFCLSACRKTDKAMEIIQKEIAHRESMYREWLNAVEQNEKLMQDAEVLEVLNFLKQGKVGRPYENSLQILSESEQADPSTLGITVLFPEDRLRGPRWQKVIDRFSTGEFIAPINTLALKSVVEFSPSEKAFTLLHEARHALNFAQGKVGLYGSREDSCAEELYTWMFQNKLMELTGGPEYQKLLEGKMAQMRAYGNPKKILAPAGGYDPRLEQIFGEAKSDDEKKLRQSAFYINAAFKLMDQDYPEEAEQQKMNVICSLYSQWGAYNK